MSKLQKVLIANRGEIAIRIARAAAGLGIKTVGVCSSSDALGLHTRMVDECITLPDSERASTPYLDVEAMINVAQTQGCDCIHPGYGFLSENAQLAAACAKAGITFVGPSAQALGLFGDKVAAKALAHSLDIPVIEGSERAMQSIDEALAAAANIGYPIMIKAAAGGGGRGMRAVENDAELTDAFPRCCSEALAAFGDGAVFLERLVVRPRHIEVQVLADHTGAVVHLFERDCSVQQRNQKVVEIAPAPNLDETVREQLLACAQKLATAGQLTNAATVEFLVQPESEQFYFIECNPRIQVEHTVTEQVMGVDLVELQFQLAGGATVAELGLGDQQAIGRPRGFALQARVVAQGAGALTAYKEPSGVGVRVDGHGYVGYAPPPEFDPLLAKLICHHQSSYAGAVQRLARSLDEFHVAGVATNLNQLRSILGAQALREGDARTTLLTEIEQNRSVVSVTNEALALLDRQAKTVTGGGKSVMPGIGREGLIPAEGERGAECPMAGTVVEIAVVPGQQVKVGDTLIVVSAMKMETSVTAPCSGTVAQVFAMDEGDAVSAGQILVCIAASSDDAAQEFDESNSWLPTMADVDKLRALAEHRLRPESDEPGVVRQRSRGKLTCRERITKLLDPGSFREVGSITGFASYDEAGAIDAFTPANHVGGWGQIDQRLTIVCADDFTSRGGHADGAIGAKSLYLDRLSIEMRVPSVRLLDGSSGGGSVAAMVPQQKTQGESKAKESEGAIKAGRPRVAGSGGSFLPGHLGSTPYTKQLSTVPVVNLLLGSVVGIGAAKAVLGHFSVMVKDIAQLFVAGPPVVSHAMGYDITKEDLGGWHIHCTNGSVDNLANSEEEAIDMSKRFLSYLPSSVYEAPAILDCADPVARREEELLTLIPRKRTATFDVRRAIRLMADKDSFFEIGSLWGTDQVTGFVRFNGHPMGVIATDSRHVNGGALTADGCDKLKRHLDLCDTFHIPLLNLIDNPGFAVGLEHEMAGTIRKGGEWMVAFAQLSIPMFSVLMRRSFGVAGNNYATPRSSPSVRVTWPAADVGGIPPEGGIEAAYKRQLAEAEDPAALRAELNARIESARGPIGPLNRFQIEEMIDPRDTRRLICEWVPTAYRIINHPDHLGPRALQFRP